MSYDEALMLGAPTVPTYTVGPSLSPEEYRARCDGHLVGWMTRGPPNQPAPNPTNHPKGKQRCVRPLQCSDCSLRLA